MNPRHIIITALAIFFIVAKVSAANRLQDCLPQASVGYAILDLRTNRYVAEHNAEQSLIPASTLKVVTAAAALAKHGANYRFKTDITAIGHISNDTLRGDIVIKGVGDPSINTSLIDSIKAKNISHVTGGLIIQPYCEPHINETWMVEDIATDYGVGWVPFNYNHNQILINDDHHAAGSDVITADVEGDLYKSGITIEHDPAKVFMPDTILLSRIYSPTLFELVEVMIKESDNLYAEAIGRTLSPNKNYIDALDSITCYAVHNGVDPKSTKIKDFCGLSRTNLISPRSMVKLLSSARNNDMYLKLFPRVGNEGTVKNFMQKSPLRNSLILKTGSMNGILNYVGYKLDSMGKPTHIIVIMVNNALLPTTTIKQEIERCITEYFM